MKRIFALIIIVAFLLSIFPKITIPVKAEPGDPTIQDVGITFWSYSTSLPGPITATTGGDLRLWYQIDNPNTTSIDLIMGASIIDPDGSEICDQNNDKLVTVNPGISEYSRDFEIPRGIQLGSYEVAFGIWKADWSIQYDLSRKYDWLVIISPVILTLTSNSTNDPSTNIGQMEFDGVVYSLPQTIYVETRQHSSRAISPSGYNFVDWQGSGNVEAYSQSFGYANVYVYGSGGINAVFESSPSFDMWVYPEQPMGWPLRVVPGSSNVTSLLLDSRNGFSGWIDLTLGWTGGRPSWVIDDSFSSNPVYLAANGSMVVALNISVSDAAANGTYHLTVCAVSGSVFQISPFDLKVLQIFTVTFDLGPYWLWIDGEGHQGSGSISFNWIEGTCHSFSMMSPGAYPGLEGLLYLIFRQWNDGSESNPRQITVEENATFYPIIDEYWEIPCSAAEGGSVTASPSPSPWGWLQGTRVTFTAIPFSGYQFDHWTVRTSGYDYEHYCNDINPLVVTAIGPQIFKAYFSALPPPPEAPTAILSLQSDGGNVFNVGDSVPFSGSSSYSAYEEGYIVSYFFDFGDGYNSGWTNSYTTTHAYTTSGTYFAELKVRDNYGYESDWSSPVQVIILSSATFDIQVSPETQTVQPEPTGDILASYQISLISENGFSSTFLDLEASVSPNAENLEPLFFPPNVQLSANGQATSSMKVFDQNAPLQVYTITITATSQSITRSKTVKLIIERDLDVPYQHQDGTEWCASTSLGMTLQYYGIVFHNWDYAELESAGTDKGASILDLENFIYKYYYPTVVPEYGYYNNKEIMLNAIRSNISSGYPVILPLSSSSGGAHDIVLVGYNESGLFVNDPSGALFRNQEFLNLSPGDPRYPEFLVHAYIGWSDLKPFANPNILSIHGASSSAPSGNIWIEDKRGIVFAVDEPRLQLEMGNGLHWTDSSTGKVDSIVPVGSSLSIKLCVSNNQPASQSFEGHVYIMSGGDVVHELEPESSSNLPGLTYDTMPYQDPQPQITFFANNLDQYLEEGVKYYLEISVYDSQGIEVDYFYSPPFYWGQAPQSIKMQEPNHRLYLHVYDAQGRHVGVNNATNQTELGIPDTVYYDDGNGTTTIILPEIMNVTIVVDARFAEEPLESYNLTVTLYSDIGNYSQTRSGNIALGEKQTFTTQASETGLTLHQCLHSVAVTSVMPPKTIVIEGYAVNVTVALANLGDYTETFNVTLYGEMLWGWENDTFPLYEFTQVTLTPGSTRTLTVAITLPAFPWGSYVLKAYAWPVPGETRVSDNTCIRGFIRVYSLNFRTYGFYCRSLLLGAMPV